LPWLWQTLDGWGANKKKRKANNMTIIEQLEGVQGEMATLKASLETANAGIVAKDGEIEALKGQIVVLQTAKDGLETIHAGALVELQGKLDVEIAAHADSKKVIEDAQRKLSDPAFAMASVKGDDVAVADGGAVGGGVSEKSKNEQLKAISDPKEKRAFYLANEKEIKLGL
jgi:hypothetical protein